jgi:23S rRNA pseudouridine2605 synthase
MAKNRRQDMAKKKPTQPASPRKKVKTKATRKPPKSSDERQRLQRVMASAGIGSRRECEIIIEEGRVEVDGEIVATLGVKVDPNQQEIYVDAQKLVVQRLQYFMLNKPPGIVSTSKDPSGRPRVIDLIATDQRVYNVGRLDQSSEGLILVTNDGELANRLTHPRYGVEKKYHVQVVGIPAPGELRKLEQGVYLAEGLAKASKAKFLKRAKNGCWLEIVLSEGRNREIRRLLASIGHKVRTLKRVSIGPLKLGDLPKGAHRPLLPAELRALKKATAGGAKPRPRKPPKTKPAKSDDVSESKTTTKRSDGGKPQRKKSSRRSPSAASSRGAAKGRQRDSGRKKKSAGKTSASGGRKRPAKNSRGRKRG